MAPGSQEPGAFSFSSERTTVRHWRHCAKRLDCVQRSEDPQEVNWRRIHDSSANGRERICLNASRGFAHSPYCSRRSRDVFPASKEPEPSLRGRSSPDKSTTSPLLSTPRRTQAAGVRPASISTSRERTRERRFSANLALSLPLAQRITAERIHEAARSVFGSATPESPLGLLCQTLKTTLKPLLSASIGGSRVNTECHKKTIPVQFGEFAP